MTTPRSASYCMGVTGARGGSFVYAVSRGHTSGNRSGGAWEGDLEAAGLGAPLSPSTLVHGAVRGEMTTRRVCQEQETAVSVLPWPEDKRGDP